ncbi:isochorismatase family protein [Pseudonocardia sp. TRM90224]|uniref:isochorismatase family protein n=1 Tax=Pseudonocardia sp. TRM90224 TaxID=2812678 RepID=UPI001E2F7412|nr:isochorismatase family protein [Pseudonocardia sp. TRM90224]
MSQRKALPTVPAYRPPTPSEYPPSRVGWALQPHRAALLVHDMQRYFLAPYGDGDSPLPGVLAGIADLAARCRAAGIPVVYTAQPAHQTPEQRGLLTDMWGEGIGAVSGSRPELELIAPEVEPGPDDVLLQKWRYSAFQRSDLAERLAGWGRDQLVITGVYASIGCLTTAVEAFMRDVQPFLVGDAVADFTRADHEHAIDYVARRCGVVTTVDQVLAAVGSVAEPAR